MFIAQGQSDRAGVPSRVVLDGNVPLVLVDYILAKVQIHVGAGDCAGV